jgi:hypothetical protein
MWNAKNGGSGCERIGRVKQNMTERERKVLREVWRKARIGLRN